MKDRLNKAWEFEITLNESKNKIKSWLFMDRIKNGLPVGI
jgi:hypothetical protein